MSALTNLGDFLPPKNLASIRNQKTFENRPAIAFVAKRTIFTKIGVESLRRAVASKPGTTHGVHIFFIAKGAIFKVLDR